MNRELLLCIDGGNTNVVFALFEGKNILCQWRLSTSPKRTADEYGVWLTNLLNLNGYNLRDIKDVSIANVVPQISFQLRELTQRYFDCTPLCVESYEDIDISVLIENPTEVGADRLVNAVAAHRKYPGWLIVIDFGTATTFDVVRNDGAYVGGVIAPGVNLSLDALGRAAARLPPIAIKKPKRVLGWGTVSAMQSGVFWGYVSLIEGLVSRIKSELGQEITVVATGGLATLFSDSCGIINAIDEDLTLKGLQFVHEMDGVSAK